MKYKWFGAAAALGMILTGLTSLPAQASSSVLLPDTANGTNNSDVLAFVCPTKLWVTAPSPVTDGTNRLSEYQPKQLGPNNETFSWDLSLVSGTTDRLTGVSTGDEDWMSTIAYNKPSGEWTAGETLTLELKGKIANSGLSESSFTFQTQVLDPSFQSGSGTFSDPYVITDEADLNKARCHEDKYFKLGQDITLSTKWMPLMHNSSREFSGGLDGNGKKISGLDVGHRTISCAGLLGITRDANIHDLTIVSPTVSAFEHAGALACEVEEGTTIDNIAVTNANVTGNSDVGLLVGQIDAGEGTLFSKVSVEGTIRGLESVYQRESDASVHVFHPREIGGVVGHVDEGAVFEEISVDVTINAITGRDFLAGGPTVNDRRSIFDIGGFAGVTDQQTYIDSAAVTAELNIQAFGDIQEAGLFVGTSESQITRSKANGSINIVSLGSLNTNRSIQYISGGIGFSTNDAALPRFTEIDSVVNVSNATSANNSLEKVSANTSLSVSQIGGLAGRIVSGGVAKDNRVKLNLEVNDAASISGVGGFAGVQNSNSSMTAGNNAVTGSISLDASGTIDLIGGFVGHADRGSSSGKGDLLAVTVSTSGDATVTNTNAWAGLVDHPEIQKPVRSYWNPSGVSVTNANSFPVATASTSQLQDKAFLTLMGYDFDKIWQLNGGYPELRAGVRTLGDSGVTATETVYVDRPVPSRYRGAVLTGFPTGPIESCEGLPITLNGQNLSDIDALKVGTLGVPFTVNGSSLTFTEPCLDPGSYDITIGGDGGSLAYKDILDINSTSAQTDQEQSTVSSDQVVNAGSFKGYVAVYAKGYEGKKLSAKIGNDWVIVDSLASDFERITDFTGAGYDINVRIFIDGVLTKTVALTTK